MFISKIHFIYISFQRELRERMLAKISLLREEHDVLLHEKKENDNSGKRILVRLEQMATDKEVDKYRQFLEEIEHITKLTVGLTIRLSRLTKKIENGRSQLSSEMVFMISYVMIYIKLDLDKLRILPLTLNIIPL